MNIRFYFYSLQLRKCVFACNCCCQRALLTRLLHSNNRLFHYLLSISNHQNFTVRSLFSFISLYTQIWLTWLFIMNQKPSIHLKISNIFSPRAGNFALPGCSCVWGESVWIIMSLENRIIHAVLDKHEGYLRRHLVLSPDVIDKLKQKFIITNSTKERLNKVYTTKPKYGLIIHVILCKKKIYLTHFFRVANFQS